MKNRKLALLINFIPPYHIPTFKILAGNVGAFRIFISTPMEPNRNWTPNWSGLNVVVQHSFTIRSRWKHPQGFSDSAYVQIPYDTIVHLIRERPDVVISTEMGFRSMIALLYRLINRSSRIIFWLPLSEHTEKGRGWMRNLIRKLFIQRGDAFFVNGESGARYIRQHGVNEEQIFRVAYPTDKEKFFITDVERSETAAHRLLYIGQLIERKGILPFLDALVQWASNHPKRTINFHIVGEGKLGSKISQVPLPANLKLILKGSLPYEQLKGIYAQAGILAFPTFADEWGIVVNEALISGLPVLGSIYSQAVEELVDDGETGWIFVPDDPLDVYRAIDIAMNTPNDTLNNMRKVGQAKALGCSPDRIVESMLKAVSYVCGES